MIKNFTCEYPYSMLNMTMEGDYQTCSWSKVYPKYHNSSPNSFFNSSLLKNIRSDMANGIFSSDIQEWWYSKKPGSKEPGNIFPSEIG